MDDPVKAKLIYQLVSGINYTESQMAYDLDENVCLDFIEYMVEIPYLTACSILSKLEDKNG